jgi:hypothetical protein
MADTPSQVFSSRLHILAVENEDRIGKTSGKTYRHFAARCIVLNDAGDAMTVGTLRSDQIVPELRESITKDTRGIYRAGYGLRVPDYGDDKGDVLCMVVSLVPEAPVQQRKPVTA